MQPRDNPASLERLRTTVAELQDTIRLMEEQRETEIRRRRRNLLIIGVSVSLLVHTALMIYLNVIERRRPAATGVQPVSIEFAVLQDAQLTQLEDLEFEELLPEVPMDAVDAADEPTLDLDPQSPAANLDIVAAGAVPTLSGSGGGEGMGLAGGGAGTSFFGISSRGTRFAYIVDISGSMLGEGKLEAALGELARSVEVLPDYAYYHVLLFATRKTRTRNATYFIQPPFQHGWVRARRNRILDLIHWMNRVDAGGGTDPEHAFGATFTLEPRPDVIFFLTDGEIPREELTRDVIVAGNRRGRRVVINTIAFGDDSSQDFLQEIAMATGGRYRFVQTGQW